MRIRSVRRWVDRAVGATSEQLDVIVERDPSIRSRGEATLHPALRRDAAPPVPPVEPRWTRGLAVLFVCIGNSARSPIAEALLRHHAAGHVTVTSAGNRPKRHLHPNAIRVLRERCSASTSPTGDPSTWTPSPAAAPAV